MIFVKWCISTCLQNQMLQNLLRLHKNAFFMWKIDIRTTRYPYSYDPISCCLDKSKVI